MITTYQLAPLTCTSCIAKIDKVVSGMPGVKSVRVMFNASKVKVETDGQPNPDIAQTIEQLGYQVLAVE